MVEFPDVRSIKRLQVMQTEVCMSSGFFSVMKVFLQLIKSDATLASLLSYEVRRNISEIKSMMSA